MHDNRLPLETAEDVPCLPGNSDSSCKCLHPRLPRAIAESQGQAVEEDCIDLAALEAESRGLRHE